MVSVIIPTYNRATLVKEAIQSVLDQDFFLQQQPKEVYVIDDGSTDNTRETVAIFGDQVRYQFQEHKGVSAARNLGLKLTQGEYVAYLDSDDLWKKNKLSVQMNYMQAHPEARVCCTEEIWIRHGVFVNPGKKHQKYSGWVFDKFLSLCLLSLSSALFRRKMFDEIGDFDENLPACEDYDLGLRMAARYPIHFISQPLIIKRGGHTDQLSKKHWGMDRFRVIALEKALESDLTSEQKHLVKQELLKKSQILINGFKKRGKHRDAEKYIQMLHKYSIKLE